MMEYKTANRGLRVQVQTLEQRLAEERIARAKVEQELEALRSQLGQRGGGASSSSSSSSSSLEEEEEEDDARDDDGDSAEESSSKRRRVDVSDTTISQ